MPAARAEEMRAYLAQRPSGPRPKSDWNPIERFRTRALALESSVDEVETMASVPAAVARYLKANHLPMNAVVWPELAAMDWKAAGIEAEARKAEGRDLVGITASFCAVAETGTLLLLSGAPTPASTSLLPETHVAIVPTARIVKGMEDAWALVRAEHGELPRATNFVSGPSRTADIEQTLVLGAHGPYRVHVVLVQG
jgi:L-lactate dehydrogenase complex protein LldG